jgi:hypothetical protein
MLHRDVGKISFVIILPYRQDFVLIVSLNR